MFIFKNILNIALTKMITRQQANGALALDLSGNFVFQTTELA